MTLLSPVPYKQSVCKAKQIDLKTSTTQEFDFWVEEEAKLLTWKGSLLKPIDRQIITSGQEQEYSEYAHNHENNEIEHTD